MGKSKSLLTIMIFSRVLFAWALVAIATIGVSASGHRPKVGGLGTSDGKYAQRHAAITQRFDANGFFGKSQRDVSKKSKASEAVNKAQLRIGAQLRTYVNELIPELNYDQVDWEKFKA